MSQRLSSAAQIAAMLAAFVVTLELEAILRLAAHPGTWFSQLINDASTGSVLYACTLPTAVLAAWGCGSFTRRLTASLFAATWLYMIWQIAMQIHSRRVVGIGEVGLLLSYFCWTLLALIGLRWKYGIAFAGAENEPSPRPQLQFALRDVFLGMLAVGITLGVGRYAFPPQNYELEFSLVQYALTPAAQVDVLLHSAIVLPVTLAIVFRWRWLPAACLISLSAVAVGVPYYAWKENATLARVLHSVPYLASRFYFTAWPLQVLPLLLALRLTGCQLKTRRSSESSSPASPSVIAN